jgi:hypothetical protein
VVVSKLVSALFLLLVLPRPLLAQIDLSGEWNNVFHEDQTSRSRAGWATTWDFRLTTPRG